MSEWFSALAPGLGGGGGRLLDAVLPARRSGPGSVPGRLSLLRSSGAAWLVAVRAGGGRDPLTCCPPLREPRGPTPSPSHSELQGSARPDPSRCPAKWPGGPRSLPACWRSRPGKWGLVEGGAGGLGSSEGGVAAVLPPHRCSCSAGVTWVFAVEPGTKGSSGSSFEGQRAPSPRFGPVGQASWVRSASECWCGSEQPVLEEVTRQGPPADGGAGSSVVSGGLSLPGPGGASPDPPA